MLTCRVVSGETSITWSGMHCSLFTADPHLTYSIICTHPHHTSLLSLFPLSTLALLSSMDQSHSSNSQAALLIAPQVLMAKDLRIQHTSPPHQLFFGLDSSGDLEGFYMYIGLLGWLFICFLPYFDLDSLPF